MRKRKVTNKEEKNTNRLVWLDYLSAIGTIMVFMQHSCVPNITRVILAFHMPLFFWISGYLYRVRENDRQCSRQYIVSKAKRLMIPHYFWLAVSQMIAYMKGTEVTIKSIGHELLYCASWFLPCLFVSEIAVHFIIRKVKYVRTHSYLFALFFWAASWIENQIMPARLIFCLDTSLMAIGFIFAGYASARVVDQLFSLSKAKKWLSAVFLAGGYSMCALERSCGC